MNKYADKVFLNGKIYTMDAEMSIKQAVAVKEGRIIKTGSSDEIKDLIDEKTIIIDLEGNTMLPGFVECHLHAPGAAYNKLFNANLFNALSCEETMDEIKRFVDNNPQKDSYYGRGFNSSFFDPLERALGPRKERLDEICSDKPIILTDFGGHVMWMNSKAFEINNITEDTVSPAGGVIEKDPDTGRIWGTLKEYAKQLVPFQSFTDEEAALATDWFQNDMHKNGYTSIFALRPSGAVIPRETIFHSFKLLEDKGELKLRINGARDIHPNDPLEEQIEDLINLKNKYESDLIKVKTAKYFADGVIEGVTGCLLEPYEEAAGKGDNYYGEFIWDKEKLAKSFQQAIENDFQIHVHSIGDGATRYTLDALEKAISKTGYNKNRNVLTHLQLVDEKDLKRMEAMGIIANVQTYWHFKSPTMWPSMESPFIGSRAEYEYPLKSLFDAGLVVTAGSDNPITPIPNPFHAIQAAVTRNLINAKDFGLERLSDADDPRWLLNKNERVSVADMIKAYTINGAYQLFREDDIGSIETGKYADFIITDRDPFSIDVLELEDTKIVETIFSGETVYTIE